MRGERITKKLKIFRSKLANGDTHFVIPEYDKLELLKEKNYGEAEALEITKKEASKPLLLLRGE